MAISESHPCFQPEGKDSVQVLYSWFQIPDLTCHSALCISLQILDPDQIEGADRAAGINVWCQRFTGPLAEGNDWEDPALKHGFTKSACWQKRSTLPGQLHSRSRTRGVDVTEMFGDVLLV